MVQLQSSELSSAFMNKMKAIIGVHQDSSFASTTSFESNQSSARATSLLRRAHRF